MYAVIKTGGKQYRVAEGDRLDVELMSSNGSASAAEPVLTPLMLVDGDNIITTPSELADASVTARVIGESKGKKITGFVYKNKSNNRRRWGHRQKYSVVEITGISTSAKKTSNKKDDKQE